MSVSPQTAAASTIDVSQARYDAGPPRSAKFNSRWDISASRQRVWIASGRP